MPSGQIYLRKDTWTMSTWRRCNWFYTWWISLDCMDFSSDNWLEFHSVTPYEWVAVSGSGLQLPRLVDYGQLERIFITIQYSITILLLLYRSIFIGLIWRTAELPPTLSTFSSNSSSLVSSPWHSLEVCDSELPKYKGFASQLIIVVALSHTATTD